MSTYHLRHCPSNPTLEYAESVKLPLDCTEIVSEGGGSTIDVGKWLADKYNLRHTAIPTTAGTGSEVTSYCVLKVNGKKHTFDLKVPDSYILDPSRVVTLTELHTISSGLDAFSQALESLWSKKSTDESRAYSRMAVMLIEKSFVESIKNPEDPKLRMDMLMAANFAGRAIEITRTNVCHAISYPLSDLYDIPHGIACSMSLAYFTKKALDLDIKKMLKKIDIPTYKFDVEEVINESYKNEKMSDFPTRVTKEDIRSSLPVV